MERKGLANIQKVGFGFVLEEENRWIFDPITKRIF